VCDSSFAGRSAELIVGIKEKNMVGGYVSGWARIRHVATRSTRFSLLSRRTELVCQQPTMTPEGRVTREEVYYHVIK
jgi:hypothetical protein